MRILILGRAIPTQPDRCTGQQLVQGFIEAGHDAVFYGNFYGNRALFLGYKELQSYPSFDLVIETEMNDGEPKYTQLRQYFKLQNIPWLLWDFDVSYQPEHNLAYAGSHPYDGYLVANKLWVEKFATKFNRPVLHLPYACSPTIHRRKPEIIKQFITGFVGNMTSERQALMGSVRCVNGVFGEALINETNQLYTMVHINQNACKGLVPGRPWETAGCGTNLLMDRASYEDFREFIPEYLDGSAVCPFDNLEEIQKYIRDNHDRFESLNRSGRLLMEYVHRQHSYKNRAETILQWAKTNGILTATS